MESSKAGLERIIACVNKLEFMKDSASVEDDALIAPPAYTETLNQNKQKFINAMEDDLNTADAIAAIFDIVSEENKYMQDGNISHNVIVQTLDTIEELADVLGILQSQKPQNTLSAETESLLAQRATARANKDWAKSDELRDTLKSMGILVEDTSQGQKITIANN